MTIKSKPHGICKLWMDKRHGTYYASWQEKGKNRRKALSPPGNKHATKDKALAIKLLNIHERNILHGKIASISKGVKISFDEFKKDFLKQKETTTNDQTYRLYNDALKKARACWGNIPMNHITARHLDSFISDMIRSGLKVPTVNKHFRHVRAALKIAAKWEYIKTPLDFSGKTIKEKKQVRYIPIDHLQKIFEQITNADFFDFCMLSGYTGLRSGEIIRLQWEDIDNPTGFIRVTSEQKNKTESRIPINTHAREILKRLAARGHTKISKFNCLTHISHLFKAAVRNAGFEKYRFHDLRHSFASHLAMQGATGESIKELMRHESYESTKVYMQLSPTYLAKVSEKLNYGPMVLPLPKKRKK